MEMLNEIKNLKTFEKLRVGEMEGCKNQPPKNKSFTIRQGDKQPARINIRRRASARLVSYYFKINLSHLTTQEK